MGLNINRDIRSWFNKLASFKKEEGSTSATSILVQKTFTYCNFPWKSITRFHSDKDLHVRKVFGTFCDYVEDKIHSERILEAYVLLKTRFCNLIKVKYASCVFRSGGIPYDKSVYTELYNIHKIFCPILLIAAFVKVFCRTV